MQFLTRFLPPFFFSWLLTFTSASVFHSQYVVNQLVNVGIKVNIADNLTMTLDDWLGLLPTYGSIIAIAFLIAFPIANKLSQKLGHYRQLLFVTSGICALGLVLVAIESIMNIHIIAGARGWGFYAQLLAGGCGGYLFFQLIKNKTYLEPPRTN